MRTAAVVRERDKRDRLRRLAASEKREIEQLTAAAEDDPEAQARLAQRVRECQSCFDELREVDGYICEGPDEHYVCDECFSNSVNHQFGGNDLGQLEVQNGQMVCQFCAKGDQKPISEAQIVRHAGTEALKCTAMRTRS